MEEQPVREERMQLNRRVRRMSTSPPLPRPIFARKQQEGRSGTFECVLRAVLFCLFFMTENIKPFQRVIQPEEMWLYRYPIPEITYFEQVGGPYLQLLLDPLSMIFYIIVVLIVKLLFSYNPLEARQAAYAFFLALPFTGTVINIMKNIAGRPRPDFLARCYGPYYYLRYSDMSRTCFNDDMYAQDGRKSFPSGHSALAACCFGFLAIYLAGQYGSFQERAKNKITSVILTLPILLIPVIVAISRTCDNKHHWQDVSVGLLIGFSITYLSYRIYFPSLTDQYSHLPYISIPYPLENVLPRSGPLYSSDDEEDDDLDLSDDGYDDNDNSIPLQICPDCATSTHPAVS